MQISFKEKLNRKTKSITESFTKKRMEALKKPREDFENVWTSDGNIYDKAVSDGSKIQVYYDLTGNFKALLKTIDGKKLMR